MIEQAPPRLLQLKVQLRDVHPAVWRRFTFGDHRRGSKSAIPGYTVYRQSRNNQGFPRFECYLDLNHAVKDGTRLWKQGIRDLVMEICCGLHNFRARLTPWQPTI